MVPSSTAYEFILENVRLGYLYNATKEDISVIYKNLKS